MFGLEERFNELIENTRRDLEGFEKEQIKKIDTKIDEIRRLADAIQEGRLMEVIKGGDI